MLITILMVFFVGDYGLERVDLGVYVKYVEFFLQKQTRPLQKLEPTAQPLLHHHLPRVAI